jgi:deoxyribodipyrimidine photo-lyase
MPKPEIAIHWFRRDLRIEDNAALHAALLSGLPVLPLFIFDRNILDELNNRSDARVSFIHQTLLSLKTNFHAAGSDLLVLYGAPELVWKQLAEEYNIKAVYTNRDHEPYARERDAKISEGLKDKGIAFHDFKDQTVFERGDVLKDDGNPYTVYTPYSRKWKARLAETGIPEYPSERFLGQCWQGFSAAMPELESMGFQRSACAFPADAVGVELMQRYGETRDIPGIRGTSRLGLHLRFGTISARSLARKASEAHAEKFLNELIWREFYQQILWHFPQVVHQAFKPAYDRIPWLNNPEDFERWKTGTTGYPIVDAGMRELAATGYMHNRVRMITAAFLTKNLLTDWRLGEAWFAEQLLDFDLASNNGGWQWASGSGVDAAPYFRVFNPQLQTEKFDPQYRYIRQWVPEFGTPAYPRPMVDYVFSRNRCLDTYKKALGGTE